MASTQSAGIDLPLYPKQRPLQVVGIEQVDVMEALMAVMAALIAAAVCRALKKQFSSAGNAEGLTRHL
jgi:hypothetical protein